MILKGMCLLFLLAGEEVVPQPFVWKQFQGNAARDNFRRRADGIVWPKVAWHVPGLTGQPSFDGRFVYSGGKKLARVDARNGKVTHAVEPEAADVHFAQSPVLGDRVVIARRTDGLVLAYAPDLQREVWRHVCPADHDTRHTGALSEQTYVFAAGKIVRALDARSGKLLWEWSAGDAVIYANPAVADGRVFVGSWSGTFVALDLRSGREMWSHAQQFKYGHTSPVVVDGNVVMGDRGGHVRCFDPKNGRVRWEERFGATGLSTPGHAPGRLLLGFGRSAAQWDLKTGRELQPLIGTGSNAFGSPTMVGKNFYFGNLDGHLYAHDAKKGELLWQFRVPGFVEVQGRRGAQGGRGAKGRRRPHAALDFVHTGTRIFASTSNGLYCLVQDPEKRGKRPFGVTIKPD